MNGNASGVALAKTAKLDAATAHAYFGFVDSEEETNRHLAETLLVGPADGGIEVERDGVSGITMDFCVKKRAEIEPVTSRVKEMGGIVRTGCPGNGGRVRKRASQLPWCRG